MIAEQSTKEKFESNFNKVMNSRSYFSEDIHQKIFLTFGKESYKKNKLENKYNFTNNEKEVLELICQGYTYEEIAEIFLVSLKTIKKYRERLLSKTRTKNVASLVMLSIKNGLIKI